MSIKWIGNIDELIKDKGWFAEQVREHFNEDQPIDTENRDEFINFLKDYFWG